MFNAPVPPPDSLPSPRALLRSTLIALAVAGLLLVVVVLPAEYGIDPTGVGEIIGLKRMGEIKMALALQAAADAAAEREAQAAEAAAAARFREEAANAGESAATEEADEIVSGGNLEMAEVVLEPGEEGGVDLVMNEGARVRYEWWTLGGLVDFELRGEALDADGGVQQGYAEGRAQTSDEGVLTAAFEGRHGWSWHNSGTETVTLTLRVEGDFTQLVEVK